MILNQPKPPTPPHTLAEATERQHLLSDIDDYARRRGGVFWLLAVQHAADSDLSEAPTQLLREAALRPERFTPSDRDIRPLLLWARSRGRTTGSMHR